MRKMLTVMSLAIMAGLVVTPSVMAAGNAPSVNDNNRVVGVDGGNIFYNGLVPGTSASSMMNLGLPAGGSGSPGAGTGAAMASIADLDKNVVASGAGSVEAGGLQATINADGSYNLVAAADFAGAWIVSFGAGGDGAQLAVAEAAEVEVGAVTVAAGQSTLFFAPAPVAVEAGSAVTVSLDYNTPSGDVNVAAVAFDGGIDGSVVKYTNPGGAAIATGVDKTVATSFISASGSVFAGYQVYNGGAADVTVELSNLLVVKGGPVTDFASAVDIALPALNTWAGNVLGDAGTVGPVADGAGIKLPGAGGVSNAFTMVPAVGVGELVAKASVSGSGTGTFVLTVVDPAGAFAFASFSSAAALGDVMTSGTISTAGAAIVVVQAAGFEASVASVSLMGAEDGFDAALLGM